MVARFLILPHASSRLLPVKNLTVLLLLLHLHLSHLAILLPLHFLPLLVHSSIIKPFVKLDLLRHLVLLQLAIKNALVRVLHFCLV